MPDVVGIVVLCCKLIWETRILFCGVVYRPPNGCEGYLYTLPDFMQEDIKNNTKIRIASDFIITIIKWKFFQAESPDASIADYLLDIMLCFHLPQTFAVPTRVQESFSSTLDLMFVSENPVNTDFTIEVLNGI